MGLIFARNNFRELENFAFREDLFSRMSCFTIFREDLLSRIGYALYELYLMFIIYFIIDVERKFFLSVKFLSFLEAAIMLKLF